MCRIAATDQYYGALLSVMCNEGKAPMRLDREGERGAHRVYGLVGEDGRDRGHSLFAKYVRAADNMREGYDRWTFYFSEAEVDALMRLRERGRRVWAALICWKGKGGEVALLDCDQVLDCLGVSIGARSKSVTIQRFAGKRGLRAYGTGRDMDHAIVIARGVIASL